MTLDDMIRIIFLDLLKVEEHKFLLIVLLNRNMYSSYHLGAYLQIYVVFSDKNLPTSINFICRVQEF